MSELDINPFKECIEAGLFPDKTRAYGALKGIVSIQKTGRYSTCLGVYTEHRINLNAGDSTKSAAFSKNQLEFLSDLGGVPEGREMEALECIQKARRKMV